MTCNEINIRDPFVLVENGTCYMYGTRAANFGYNAGGFDVYTSKDLVTWSDPIPVFDSARYGLNAGANWAPEVYSYGGAYYMFATFNREDGLHATYVLRAASPLGPFEPHGEKALTPDGWECLDGTLYVSPEGRPSLVFCHEHTQIFDGTICTVELSEDLKRAVSGPVVLFKASETGIAEPLTFDDGQHYVTDGPFMFRSGTGELFMIWSSFIMGRYVELAVRFADGKLGTDLEHLRPLYTEDGGHGMIFCDGNRLQFTFHSPNTPGEEHPAFIGIADRGDRLEVL